MKGESGGGVHMCVLLCICVYEYVHFNGTEVDAIRPFSPDMLKYNLQK